MKVLLIIPGGIASGIDNIGIPVINNFVNEIAQKVDLTVLSIYSIDQTNISTSYRLESLNLKPGVFGIKKIWFFLKYLRDKKKCEYDLIHGIWTMPHGLYSLIASYYFKARSIVSLQGGCQANVKVIKYGGNTTLVKRFLNHFILNRTHAITAETEFQKKLISTKLYKKVKVIYYGIDKDSVVDNIKSNYKLKDKKEIDFIHVANLTAVKDQKTLLDSFSIINKKYNSKLTIVGPDYFNNKIQGYCKEIGLQDKVSFTGFLKNKEAIKRIKDADIMLHTSLYEGSGLSVIEAWAQGTLVCGTNVGIMSDFNKVNCLASEIGNPFLIAQNVFMLIENPNLCTKIAKAALGWTQKNDMSLYTEKIFSLYTNLVR